MSAASGLSDVPLGGKAPADTLEWQSFPTSAASTAIPVATAVNAAAPGDASAAANGSASAEAAALSNSLVNLEVAPEIASPLACFTPTFAKFVFGNVTTAQVGARLSAALWPLQRVWFPQLLDKKPDFYGPFWIAATLVFLIGVGSNLASWLSFKPGDAVSLWHYDFTLVTFALVAVYSFTFALPLAVWLALSYLGITNLPLVYLVCIYGYSLTVFLPTALLSVVPSTALRWTVAMVAGALSSIFVLKSVFPAARSADAALATRIVLPGVVLLQLAFAVALKVWFFSW